MSQSSARQIRKEQNAIKTEIDKQLRVQVNEVMQVIKEEWPWGEKVRLVWFLLFSKKNAEIEL